MNVNSVKRTAYLIQNNGRVERFNCTMLVYHSSSMPKTKTYWSHFLQSQKLGYSVKRHKTTWTTLFTLDLFGQPPSSVRTGHPSWSGMTWRNSCSRCHFEDSFLNSYRSRACKGMIHFKLLRITLNFKFCRTLRRIPQVSAGHLLFIGKKSLQVSKTCCTANVPLLHVHKNTINPFKVIFAVLETATLDWKGIQSTWSVNMATSTADNLKKDRETTKPTR